jgi:hypothetical protein
MFWQGRHRGAGYLIGIRRSGHGLPCPRVSRKWVAGVEELRVRRLTAGGRWIRTIGSAPQLALCRARDERLRSR